MSEIALATGEVPPSRRNLYRMSPPLRHVAVLSSGDAYRDVVADLEKRRYGRGIRGVSVGSAGDVDDLVRRAQERRVDEVLLVLNGQDEPLFAQAIERLAACPVDITVYLGALAEAAAGLVHQAGRGEPRPLLLVRQPMRGWPFKLKRTIDVVVSGMALLFLAPLLCLVALAIKFESRGPVIFRQARNGLDQQPFMVWKFRTMRDAGQDALRQATRRDPRVTRVGAFLRRTSVDELPQLVNVLRGEMSLVGPRPHPRTLDDRFTDVLRLYKARHRVLPGMTGLAQINGCRGETDTLDKMAARLHYDLEYIATWSPWLDLRILVGTLCGSFLHANAY